MPNPKKPSTPTLKQLEAKLKSATDLFDAVYGFANAMDTSTTVSQVKVRLDKLDGLWEKVNDTILDIEMHDEYTDTDDKYSKMRKDCLQCYYDAKTLLVDKAKELEQYPDLNATNNNLNATHHAIHDHVRLPQIKLQSFDGNLDDWLSFRDLYTSLIHWKSELPDIEKFHYLKGCLVGKPRSMIESLSMTAKNYQVAWDILTRHYNDNNLLKRRQVETLFNLPKLAKESATDLQALLEGFERATKTLDQLVSQEDYKDLLLVHILSSRLDPATKRSWEEIIAARESRENKESKEKDTVKDLTDFLYTRVRVLSSLATKTAEPKVDTNQNPKPKAPFTRSSHSAVQSSEIKCVVCSQPHLLHRCPKFLSMPVAERDQKVRENRMCLNCFRVGHQAPNCLSRFVCQNCRGKHHTLVCFHPKRSDKPKPTTSGRDFNRSGNDSNGNSSKPAAQSSTQAETVSSNVAAPRTSTVLLATAVVLVEDDDGVKFPARALLDSGSECPFMTEKLCQRLKVSRKRSNVAVYGIGQANTKVKHKIQATIKSRVTEFSRRMEFLLLPKVTANLPTTDVSVAGWEFPPDVELADPAFFNSKAVDIVLGIHHFFAFFNSGKERELGVGLPTLTETVFGWIVTGNVENQDSSSVTQCNVAVSSNLEELLTRFWACEEVVSPNNHSPVETRCEELYSSTVTRGSDGRYTVTYPKDEDALARMGESRDIAYRRLQSIERRLQKEPELRRQYNQFMEEYLELGHMRRASDAGDVKRVYLPHHPVVRESSTTTKVRVVFDASCASSTGVSLNDALLVGPSIQDDLRSIILRSRTKQFMLVSDMEKMFRQIRVTEDDMKLQSILWRDDPTKEAVTYELATVTYGTKPAPFLATRTLKQLAMDEQTRYPLAAKAALEDVYMDDVLTGADDEYEAVDLRTQLDALLRSGGFRLRKWASNSPLVLQGIPDEDLALSRTGDVLLDPDPSVRTLGLVWRPTTDVLKFQFDHPTPNPNQPWTRRRIMSTIATLFDPIGFIGPVTAAAKILMQKLWTLEDKEGKKLDWDDDLPPAIVNQWLKFYEQIPALNDLTFPRRVIIPKATNVEIHVFSDASQDAYGAVSYVRSVNQAGEVRVVLLSSKSKVAPLKCQTIPRLEFCGAELAALLGEQIRKATKLDVKYHFWTDSTCVLQWLRAKPTAWNTFVANRVAKIQALTENAGWNHVPGIENPADLISRGVAPGDIKDLVLWWEGPKWLKLSPEHWPSQPILEREEEADQELRHVAANLAGGHQVDFPSLFVSKYSGYRSVIRSVAYWQRLIKILRHEEGFNQRGYPTSKELREAEVTIIRLVQKDVFKQEWQALSNNEAVGRNSPLRWFNPKLGEDNVIRVGGRLAHSEEADSAKHPMVLPARHMLTKKLLEYYHERLLHAGPQLMLATVRLKYWPLGGRNVVRHIVHNCQRCFRIKPTQFQQFMGELPSARVTVARPFSKVGVDYFGPVYIRPGPRRTAIKAYVAVFVCMCTKAVHLELVMDLSTDRFIQALRRFIGRRGLPTEIFSDNGTNFVGARNRLQELFELLRSRDHREKVTKECADKGIQWNFNPPGAPHFGGLWEAAVRSAKIHMIKVLGDNPVSYEDMYTLLIQVEACLNSRPLTQLSDDPNDLEPLTPGHFLIGSSLHQLPDLDITEVPMNRLNQWQTTQRKLQDFWRRWRTEYLAQLQGRSKRWKPAVPITVGQLVIIRDENQPSIRWKMGRIIKLHPGADGVVRVVTLKTATSILTRPVEKICVLPLPTEPENQAPSTGLSDDPKNPEN